MRNISSLSSDVHCRACEGTGVFLPAELLELEQEVRRVLDGFPRADIMGKGQWFFKPKSIVRTIALMYQKGDLEGKSIACLASPTIAVGLLLFRQYTAIEMSVTVLDIDADVLSHIERRFPDAKVELYNIADECPEHLQGMHDCFFLDPLYSEDHYKVGLSRCVQLIGGSQPDRVGYVVVPPEEIAPIRTTRKGVTIPIQLAVFGHISAMGLCVADFKDNFMEYSTPPAEAGILKRRTLMQVDRDSLDEWRGSDLVRIVSTASTQPLVSGDCILSIRVNDSRRTGVDRNFVPLAEIGTEDERCNLCPKCFSSRIDDQRRRSYAGYWPPEVYVRPMPSWRNESDQPFEVASSCIAFENIKTGELLMLRGPAAKAIWETLRDLESTVGTSLNLVDLVRDSLMDYENLNKPEVLRAGREFVMKLVDQGLSQFRLIEM